MNPERAALIMRGMLQSLDGWIEEAEQIEARAPGVAAHLLASLRQSRMALRQMLDRPF